MSPIANTRDITMDVRCESCKLSSNLISNLFKHAYVHCAYQEHCEHHECRKRQELQGREDEITQLFTSSRQALLDKHAALAVDDRSLLHLQLGCSLLASHQVLSPWIRDEQVLFLSASRKCPDLLIHQGSAQRRAPCRLCSKDSANMVITYGLQRFFAGDVAHLDRTGVS